MSEKPERQSPVPDPKRSGGMLTPAAVPEPTLEGTIAEAIAAEMRKYAVVRSSSAGPPVHTVTIAQLPGILAAVLAPIVVEVRERAVEDFGVQVHVAMEEAMVGRLNEPGSWQRGARHIRVAVKRVLEGGRP